MPIPSLNFPVSTLSGELLLSAGARLDEPTLREVAERGHGCFESYPLLEHDRVREDLQLLMSKPPYSVIFGDSATQLDLQKIMETVSIVSPCLEALNYFRSQDFYTYRHILMVFALTTLLARDLLPDTSGWMQQCFASPSHDIGKTCVPLEVLRKATPLTHSERSLLSHHPLAGYVLLCHYLGDHEHFAARVACDHHERCNGSGYPRGICLNDPMVEIITVCDIYDALISPRPYRPVSYDNRSAIEELSHQAEQGKIGWSVVKALIAHNRGVAYAPDQISVSAELRGEPPAKNSYGKLVDD